MIKPTRRTVAAAVAALGLGTGSALWATTSASAATGHVYLHVTVIRPGANI